MNLIEAHQLSRTYGLRFVLRKLDITVSKGEALLIEGGNGTGKTTLLRILATLLSPTSGELKMFGVTSAEAKQTLRRKIGVVFAESYFYSELTVTENLMLYAQLYKIEKPSVEITKGLERFQMSRFHDSRVSTLSRGERQRISILRSLLHNPELVLWDEPYVGLDTKAQEIVNSVAKEKKGKTTFVCVSHDRDAATPWIDRSVKLVEGRIQ